VNKSNIVSDVFGVFVFVSDELKSKKLKTYALTKKNLVGLAPEVNLINILQTAFASADPESAKNTVKSSVFFVLLGSSSVKTVHKTFVKLTPG